MDERLVEIRVEYGDDRPTFRKDLTASDVGGTVRDLEGEPDVTMTISPEGTDERLLVAVSGALAFLGLAGPDQVFEFVRHDTDRPGTQRLIIGGQPTDIASRSVVCVETAARVADEWLKRGRQSSLGAWERK
jgi:hypothetical protein